MTIVKYQCDVCGHISEEEMHTVTFTEPKTNKCTSHDICEVCLDRLKRCIYLGRGILIPADAIYGTI